MNTEIPYKRLDTIHRLWVTGFDTFDIAKMFKVTEAEIYNIVCGHRKRSKVIYATRAIAS